MRINIRQNTLGWILRISSALCVSALSVLSWMPGTYMARTGDILTGHQEHFLAYLFTGAFVAAIPSKSTTPMHAASALVAFAAVLELGQHFVPGRSSAFDDFFSSVLGAIAGVAAVWLVRTLSISGRAVPSDIAR